MIFRCPIDRYQLAQSGLAFVRISIPLTVVGGRHGDATYPFRFDTGADLTTVSEDVAAALGLPAGGNPIAVGGSTGTRTGRLVPVRFQFPTETPGVQGLEVNSTWVVIPGRAMVALLGFVDVHRHFTIQTFTTEMIFLPWPATLGLGP